ncbi:hypothetical protein [Streptomyces sp. NPDC048172]|uniref:hypothetical protein n=1 Tax=Streptomyces sp. NPDC048172 TaxID=3365505 RepID=UPI003719D0F2
MPAPGGPHGAPPGPYDPVTGAQAQAAYGQGTPGTVPLTAVRSPRRTPGWLWALGGALLASAVWAGSLLATGGFEKGGDTGGGKADLAGYTVPSDMCEPFDRSALAARYSEESGDPTSYGSKDPALSSAYCSVTMKSSGSDYARTYVSFTGDWHKKSDPEPEFAPRMKAYTERSDDTSTYRVRQIGGIGEEAFLILDKSQGGDTVRWARLAVRDGWFEGTLEWSNYGTGPNDGESLSETELRKMMTSDMKATLEALKK